MCVHETCAFSQHVCPLHPGDVYNQFRFRRELISFPYLHKAWHKGSMRTNDKMTRIFAYTKLHPRRFRPLKNSPPTTSPPLQVRPRQLVPGVKLLGEKYTGVKFRDTEFSWTVRSEFFLHVGMWKQILSHFECQCFKNSPKIFTAITSTAIGVTKPNHFDCKCSENSPQKMFMTQAASLGDFSKVYMDT